MVNKKTRPFSVSWNPLTWVVVVDNAVKVSLNPKKKIFHPNKKKFQTNKFIILAQFIIFSKRKNSLIFIRKNKFPNKNFLRLSKKNFLKKLIILQIASFYMCFKYGHFLCQQSLTGFLAKNGNANACWNLFLDELQQANLGRFEQLTSEV